MNPIKSLLVFCCFLLISGCDKQPLDYRTKYVGDYDFSVHYYHWHMGKYSFDTNYSTNGKIWYGSNDNTVLITLSDSSSFEFYLWEDGSIERERNFTHHLGEGAFETRNKISFKWASGGLGGEVGYEVTGEKK